MGEQPSARRRVSNRPTVSKLWLIAFLFSSLEDAMLKALLSLFSNLLGTSSSTCVEFYDKFQPEADEYDRDFMKKYDEDLHHLDLREYSCRTYVGRGIYVVLLGVQAGLFSAVTSAFIIGVQQNLEPDYQQMSYDLLRIASSLGLCQLAPMPLFPNGPAPIPLSSASRPSFTAVWLLPSSPRLSPC